MLDEEYEQLVAHLQKMLADGVQLTYNRHAVNWDKTKIPALLRKIQKKKRKAESMACKECEGLVNLYTGDIQYVIWIDSNNVTLSSHGTVVFPKDKIWSHYRRRKPGEYSEPRPLTPSWMLSEKEQSAEPDDK